MAPTADLERATENGAANGAAHTLLQDPLTVTLEGTGDGAFATNDIGLIVGWNTAAERLLGFTGREAKGRTCCQLMDGRDAFGNRMCATGCRIRTLLRCEESVQSFEMRARTKNGRPLWLSMSVLATSSDRAGSIAIHLMRDITATKELLALVHDRISTSPGTERNTEAAMDLTRRELEILRLLTEGVSTSDAAQRLHVSQSTVRNHVQNLLSKLGVHSRLEAVAYATRNRLF